MSIEDDRYSMLGWWYGYPDCCIKQFLEDVNLPIQDLLNLQHTTIRRDGRFNGFIPCEEHAIQLVNKQTTIEKLLKDRVFHLPYPLDNLNLNLTDEEYLTNLKEIQIQYVNRNKESR